MLEVHTAGDLRLLADSLGGFLQEQPEDPFQPEWVAVPSAGIRAWLARQLADKLGAATGRRDGICANINFAFPGELRHMVLAAAREYSAVENHDAGKLGPGAPSSELPADFDPWEVGTLVWYLLSEVNENSEGMPAALTGQGAEPLYSSARRVADLFDRYHHFRPSMIQSWADGRDVDGRGELLTQTARWQPELWRRLRTRIDEPSPPEVLSSSIEALRDEAPGSGVAAELPSRLFFFGLTSLPGGPQFLDLVQALPASTEVHLFLWQPSHALSELIPDTSGGALGASLRSSLDQVDMGNPLLSSWGRTALETDALLREAEVKGSVSTSPAVPSAGLATPEEPSLLRQIQLDIADAGRPSGDFDLDQSDVSVQFHAAQGATRQVEVLRDLLLHALDNPNREYSEEDLLVVCPDLDSFAPIIRSVFGPSAHTGDQLVGADGVPQLRYRITDRSLTSSNPVAKTLLDLVQLAQGRFDLAQMLDVLSVSPVRTRFEFGDDDLSTITDWLTELNIRWGLDAEHRGKWGIPHNPEAPYEANSWQSGIDRLMSGVAVHATENEVGLGNLYPLSVEGSEADLGGRLVDALWTLRTWSDSLETGRTAAGWIGLLRDSIPEFLAVDRDEQWQIDSVLGTLRDIEASLPLGRDGGEDPPAAEVILDVRELSGLLSERLGDIGGRPDFFRGGITFSSTTPLRGVPFKSVFVLGLDQQRISSSFGSSDDLISAVPQLGDREPRAELRSELLSAVMCAENQLTVIREGRDARTNQTVPPAVPVAELQDLVSATLGKPVKEVGHTRQSYDESNFVDDKSPDQSYDQFALQAANSRRLRSEEFRPFCGELLDSTVVEEISVQDLKSCIGEPIRWFFDRCLVARSPRTSEPPTQILPTKLSPLDTYGAGTRLLDAVSRDPRRAFDSVVSGWVEAEFRREAAGPPTLANKSLMEVADAVGNLIELAPSINPTAQDGEVSADDSHSQFELIVIDQIVELPAQDEQAARSVRIHGELSVDPQNASIGSLRFTRAKDKDHLQLFIDLLLLGLVRPEQEWVGTAIRRARKGAKAIALSGTICGKTDPAQVQSGLAVVVDLYCRAQREALPMFGDISRACVAGGTMSWPSRSRPEANVAFGDYQLDELLALPRLSHDPDRADTRVLSYARYLWDEVEAVVHEVPKQ